VGSARFWGSSEIQDLWGKVGVVFRGSMPTWRRFVVTAYTKDGRPAAVFYPVERKDDTIQFRATFFNFKINCFVLEEAREEPSGGVNSPGSI
jgi:hypothetical protein